MHYGLIHNGLPTQINIEESILPSVRSEFKPRNYTLCKDGDVAFADASEDTNDVGKVVEFMNCAGREIVCGLHTIHGRDKLGKTVPGFKGYAFSSSAFHNQIKRIAQGTKIFSINTGCFEETFIGIPNKEEQRKIASLLLHIDQRIALQNKVIEDLKKLKSALCEVLFSHGRTLPVSISDIGEYFSVDNLSKDDLTDSGVECVLYGELFTTYGRVISNIKSRTTRLIDNGASLSNTNDLLFPASTTVDAISLISPSAITKPGVILGGDMFGIRLSTKYNNQYMSNLLYYCYREKLASYAQGSTIIHLHYKDIEKVRIMVHPKENQDRIAAILGFLDKYIANEQEIEKVYKGQKAFFIRQLFI